MNGIPGLAPRLNELPTVMLWKPPYLEKPQAADIALPIGCSPD
jgi:hypothetical protein